MIHHTFQCRGHEIVRLYFYIIYGFCSASLPVQVGTRFNPEIKSGGGVKMKPHTY